MKKVKVENNIFVVARNSAKKGKLDYYMQLPDKTECYMFTRKFFSAVLQHLQSRCSGKLSVTYQKQKQGGDEACRTYEFYDAVLCRVF